MKVKFRLITYYQIIQELIVLYFLMNFHYYMQNKYSITAANMIFIFSLSKQKNQGRQKSNLYLIRLRSRTSERKIQGSNLEQHCHIKDLSNKHLRTFTKPQKFICDIYYPIIKYRISSTTIHFFMNARSVL